MYYGEIVVVDYYVDLLVNDAVILELKCVETVSSEHKAQLVNCLKATEIEFGLILNFVPKAEISRKIYGLARHKSAEIRSYQRKQRPSFIWSSRR